CSPASGSVFPAGVTTIVCIARDASDNQAQVSFTVTVRDTTLPALSQPGDLVVEQQTPAGAVVTFATPTATDAADPAPAVTCSPASGSVFSVGQTVVTCVATDAAGNVSAPVTFTVTVRASNAAVLAFAADPLHLPPARVGQASQATVTVS